MTKTTQNIFLFPAFVLKYKGNETSLIHDAGIDLKEKLSHVSALTQTDLTDFDPQNNSFIADELKNQLLTYLLSCVFADILISRQLKPKAMAALSMGLYAALYCGRSLSLSDGALLIHRIYQKAHSLVKEQNHGMLNVIGLAAPELAQLINDHRLNCAAVIKNGDHSYILAGEKDALQQLHVLAEETGAMHLNFLPVQLPYHTQSLSGLSQCKEELFSGLSITSSAFPIWSNRAGTWISQPEDIKNEIIENLYTPIDWQSVMESLNRSGRITFYACGPGNSIQRMARFFVGSLTIKSISDK